MTKKISRRKFILSAVTSVASATVSGCVVTPAPPTSPTKQAPSLNPTGDSGEPVAITPTTAPITGSTPIREISSEQILAAFNDPDLAAVIDILREEFNYLYLSEGDLVAFAYDLKSQAGQRLFKLRESNLDQFKYEACSQFLMSTDFFFNDMDETRPVKYRGYYDRYQGCRSPFAQFD
jgi:hypothetical protein